MLSEGAPGAPPSGTLPPQTIPPQTIPPQTIPPQTFQSGTVQPETAHPNTAHIPDDTAPGFTAAPRRRILASGWTEGRQQVFIASLADTGSVTEAASDAGMSPRSAYQLRRSAGAESFARAWDLAIVQATRMLTDVALERAINGVSEPVFDRDGTMTGVRRKYNDRLLMFLLRHHRRGVYGIGAERVLSMTDRAAAEKWDAGQSPIPGALDALEDRQRPVEDEYYNFFGNSSSPADMEAMRREEWGGERSDRNGDCESGEGASSGGASSADESGADNRADDDTGELPADLIEAFARNWTIYDGRRTDADAAQQQADDADRGGNEYGEYDDYEDDADHDEDGAYDENGGDGPDGVGNVLHQSDENGAVAAFLGAKQCEAKPAERGLDSGRSPATQDFLPPRSSRVAIE